MNDDRSDGLLLDDLAGLAAALGTFEIRLAGSGAEADREAVRRSIIRHLLPRTGDPDAPLVVAVVGPAGSGKSSLVNAMAGARLSPTGVLRPGTRYPVFWSDGPLAASLDTLRRSLGGVVVAGERRAPEGMVMVDVPPPDVDGHDGVRPVEPILEAADACVFVTSALRYADAAGWALLRVIARRNLPTVFVLNKLPDDPSVQRTLCEDLARRLAGRGLVKRPDAEMVVGIPTVPIRRDTGGPAPEVVALLRKELDALADPQSRIQVARETVEAGFADAAKRLRLVAQAAAEDRRLRLGLAGMAADAYRIEAASLRRAADEGELAGVAGEVDRLVSDLAVAATLRAARAARAACEVWSLHEAGAAVVEANPSLWAHGPRTVAAARAAARSWVDSLPDLVLAWSGRRRMRRGRAMVRAGLVQRAAIESDWAPDRRALRRMRRFEGAAVLARRDLGVRLEEVLDTDAARFADVLGPEIPRVAVERIEAFLGGGRG